MVNAYANLSGLRAFRINNPFVKLLLFVLILFLIPVLLVGGLLAFIIFKLLKRSFKPSFNNWFRKRSENPNGRVTLFDKEGNPINFQ